ncbi:MAG: hypothetical protein HY743_05350, partial [Deltaproteobacteria bacterium]|nr:hypothetical protein [Deltaproteobacteria bacterium]
GVLFEGSPRVVFWGRYIEPFLEDISFRAIDQTIRLCNEKKERLKEPLTETADLLKMLVRKTYDLMADVDRRLRGRGFPQSVANRSVNGEIAEMDRFIDARVQAENAMYKTPSIFKKIYNEHESLIKIIGIVVGVIGILLTILKIFMG